MLAWLLRLLGQLAQRVLIPQKPSVLPMTLQRTRRRLPCCVTRDLYRGAVCLCAAAIVAVALRFATANGNCWLIVKRSISPISPLSLWAAWLLDFIPKSSDVCSPNVVGGPSHPSCSEKHRTCIAIALHQMISTTRRNVRAES